MKSTRIIMLCAAAWIPTCATARIYVPPLCRPFCCLAKPAVRRLTLFYKLFGLLFVGVMREFRSTAHTIRKTAPIAARMLISTVTRFDLFVCGMTCVGPNGDGGGVGGRTA